MRTKRMFIRIVQNISAFFCYVENKILFSSQPDLFTEELMDELVRNVHMLNKKEEKQGKRKRKRGSGPACSTIHLAFHHDYQEILL